MRDAKGNKTYQTRVLAYTEGRSKRGGLQQSERVIYNGDDLAAAHAAASSVILGRADDGRGAGDVTASVMHRSPGKSQYRTLRFRDDRPGGVVDHTPRRADPAHRGIYDSRSPGPLYDIDAHYDVPGARTVQNIARASDPQVARRIFEQAQHVDPQYHGQMAPADIVLTTRSSDADGEEVLHKEVRHGEGSRGGQIVGHDRSGRPIYLHKASRPQPSWQRKGYVGPGGAWATAKRKAKEAGKDERYARAIYATMVGHKSMTLVADLSNNKEGAMSDLSKAGEGSRGGRIIGHTKRGKPIYNAGHPKYASLLSHQGYGGPEAYDAVPTYRAADHEDASRAHRERSEELRDASPEAGKAHARLATSHAFAAVALGGNDHGLPARFRNRKEKSMATTHLDLSKSNRSQDGTMSDLSKAGEGSRGGQIVGHTKSGKPIYGPGHASNVKAVASVAQARGASRPIAERARSDFASFTSQDHADAAAVHSDWADIHNRRRGVVRTSRRDGQVVKERAPLRETAHHYEQAKGHDAMASVHSMLVNLTHKSSNQEDVMIDLLKAGEGSRGGRIIGHTKSGKPIYHQADGMARTRIAFKPGDKKQNTDAVRKQNPHFTAADHMDAAKKHHEASGKASRDSDHNGADHHAHMSQGHRDAAAAVQGMDKSKPHQEGAMGDISKAGEGSRGGQIIGHTRSGKPIYSARSPQNAGVKMHFGMGPGPTRGSVSPQMIAHHKDYTAADHHDAASKHADVGEIKSTAVADAHRKLADRKNKYGGDGTAKKSEDAIDDLHAGLHKSKAGEGSRGGKVLGHTKTGKPIYVGHTPSSKHDAASHVAQTSHGFSPEEHEEAAGLHAKAATQAMHFKDRYRSDQSKKDAGDAAHGHRLIAQEHRRAASATSKSLDAFGDLHAVLRKAKSGGLEVLADDESLDADYIYDPTANGDLLSVCGAPQGDPRTAGDSGGETVEVSDLGEMAPRARVAPNAGDARGAGDSGQTTFGEGVPTLPELATDDWHSGEKPVGWTPGGMAKSAAGTSYSPQELAHEQARELAMRRSAAQGGQDDVSLGLGVPGAPLERQPLAKARVVQTGMVTQVYGGVDDRAAALAAGGDFWSQGRSPSLDARGCGPAQRLCKSCQGAHPAYLTACPACGVGSTLQKSQLSADSSQEVQQPVSTGAYLRPAHTPDLYLPSLPVGPR